MRIEKTYEPTGSYTYYDFWPVSSDMGFSGAKNDVAQAPQNQVFVMESSSGTLLTDEKALTDWLQLHDVSQLPDIILGYPENTVRKSSGAGEGGPADGILRLDLTPEQSFNLNKSYQSLLTQNKMYNAEKNNCSSFVCEGLEGIGLNLPKERNNDWKGFLANGWPVHTFQTPNNTYKQLLKQTQVKTTVVKDGSRQTQQNFEEAVLDDY